MLIFLQEQELDSILELELRSSANQSLAVFLATQEPTQLSTVPVPSAWETISELITALWELDWGHWEEGLFIFHVFLQKRNYFNYSQLCETFQNRDEHGSTKFWN